MKYPIGIQSFDQIIEGNWVYVDKTDLVYRLVTTTKTCFLSRPRKHVGCLFQGAQGTF